MIFLVPNSPEVPPRHKPRLWQGLLCIFVLGLVHLRMQVYFDRDYTYLMRMDSLPVDETMPLGGPSPETVERFLKTRPLLEIAPSKGSWDIRRLIYANFLHEGPAHLLLNMIGVFAGMRICSTFVPFAVSIALFLLGGSLGLFASLMLSTEPSAYIPHLGSSAGLFALMGAYYIYNFRYRTRYFFWFPSRRGFINLRTSWFFFVDAFLMEIVLSLAQLFPSRLDSVDHLAHVVGFSSGMVLAILVRFFQRWPSFLQIRPEFTYWKLQKRADRFDSAASIFEEWIALLEINAYNDQVKLRLYALVASNPRSFDDDALTRAFRFLSPTFIRLQPEAVSHLIRKLLQAERNLPDTWLKATPYDSIIRLARFLASPPEEQAVLLQFVSAYRRAHPEGGDLERKLELLTSKLSGLVAARRPPDPPSDRATGS